VLTATLAPADGAEAGAAATSRALLAPQVSAPGAYLGTLPLADSGRMAVTVTALRGRDTLGVASALLLADTLGADQPLDEEGGARLRAMARATGGQAYDPATVAALPADAAITRAGITVKEAHDVWDMPVLFLLLLALLGAEWGVRRWRGLA
jgi:hypothetical protein